MAFEAIPGDRINEWVWKELLIDENGDEIIVIKFERMGFSGVFLLPNMSSALVYSAIYTIILMVLV